MGRKSAKGKERKQKRKEETAKLDAAVAKVDIANKIEDPMSLLEPFRKFERNGLNLTIESKRVTDLDKETIDWAFDLTRLNMQELYIESEWGWKDKEKYEEMTEDRAIYLIARNQDKKPVAFTHYRFDIEDEIEVVYCYEVQVTDEVRRKGVGKFLMQILELLAYKTEMQKVVLTAFKNNELAMGFFKNALKYTVDDTSPDDPVFAEGYCYEILSKAIKPKSSPKTSPRSEPMQTSPVKTVKT